MAERDEAPERPEIRYADAITELKEILRGVEEESIDLDDLSEKVERAAILIRACRARITETEMRVRRVLEDLDGDQSGS